MKGYVMNRESLKRHCKAMCEKFKTVTDSGTYGEHRLVLELLEQTEWIPVTEKLPEDDERVLATIDAGSIIVTIVTYDMMRGAFYNTFGVRIGCGTDVLAWMPLPKPYKEGDKE